MPWSRRCPRCRQLLTKEQPWIPWYCPKCHWVGGDDVSRPYEAPDATEE